jgi:hypothetical protein
VCAVLKQSRPSDSGLWPSHAPYYCM